MFHDRCRTTIKVFDESIGIVDTQMVVDRRQKIARAADAFDRIFAAFIGGSDESSGFNTATRPDV